MWPKTREPQNRAKHDVINGDVLIDGSERS